VGSFANGPSKDAGSYMNFRFGW